MLSNDALDDQERALVARLRAYRALHRDRLTDLLRQVESTDSGQAELAEKGFIRRINGMDTPPGEDGPAVPLIRAN